MKSAVKINLKIFLIVLIIGLTFFFFDKKRIDKIEDQGAFFNNAYISGVLTNCSANKDGTFFTINDSVDYWFLPTRKLDDRFQMFCRDAEIGDYIEKKSFANELYLIKNQNDTIKYYFVKFFTDGRKEYSGDD